jgi:hypothetical protein
MEERAKRMNASANTSDTVLARARVREVTGVFHSRAALDVAAGELLLMGFDRAEELADVPQTPRRPFIAREDVSTINTVVASVLGAAAAMATAYFLLASGAGGGEAAVAAALVGFIVAGAGFLLVARIFGRDEARGLDNLMAARGLILWVRVRSPEQEDLAQEILRAHRAQAVRVHEIELEERPEDLPFSTVRPDPWLGSEPLGHP